jgi:tetratricopeptide (TPR) repeat protein
MTTAHRNWLSVAVLLVLFGCASAPPQLDPEALWQRADRQHAAALDGIAQREQLQSDYQAIVRLSNDGDLRGRAYVRLAEIDLALGEYKQAGYHLEQSLRADLPPEDQRRVLLMLGDLMDRHLRNEAAATIAYQQVINEHPATPESELAALRLGALDDEQR